MQESNDETAVPEGPQIKADTWFALAIAGFFITLTVFSGVAIWVFTAEPAVVVQRAQAFTPFGAALIATVTFFTIAWRGVLNTKQLEYQAEQIRHQADQLGQTRRQNDAKDDENLAKLLMDGTKLLGEDRESHVLAGVAALQAVVTSPRGAFAPQAMDILVDLVQRTYKETDKAKIFDAAREAVNLGAAAGRASTRTLILAYDDDEHYFSHAVNGVRLLVYRHAYIDYTEYPRFTDLSHVRFENCLIEEAEIRGNHRNFKNCELQACIIKTMNSLFLGRNSFADCNFSGAEFEGASRSIRIKGGGRTENRLERLKGKNNFFYVEEPITGGSQRDWEMFLERLDANGDPIGVEILED